MKNITQLLFLFVLLIYGKIPGQIASWDFTGQNNVTSSAATTFDPNLNSSNLITRGTDAASSTGANSFRTKSFKMTGFRYQTMIISKLLFQLLRVINYRCHQLMQVSMELQLFTQYPA